MSKKISHSAMNKYGMCPRMYEFHYIKRLRPTGTSSALVFGTAIDEALNALLLKTGDPLKVFRDNFTWDMCSDIKWFKSDLDAELFSKEQLEGLQEKSTDYANWACMRIKGRLMIESYIKNIYPKITEVHDVQLQTKRPGFIDAIISIDGYGKVLIDHKTSSRLYKRDVVASSSQLALYAGQVKVSRAGFIVLSKQINKRKRKQCRECGHDCSGTAYKTCPKLEDDTRCRGSLNITTAPEAICQLIVDDIPKSQVDFVKDSIESTEKAIEAKVFPANLGSCDNMFGRPCPYYNKCRNNSNSGLEVVPEDKRRKK